LTTIKFSAIRLIYKIIHTKANTTGDKSPRPTPLQHKQNNIIMHEFQQ